jgi:regulator of sigma E protease
MELATILLAFVFVLGVVIVVHESGHFMVAKAVGVYVKTFSIGFGPKLLRRRFGETEYALSAVPFGGYVKMAGEGVMEQIQDAGTGETSHDGSVIPEHRFFSSKTTFQRLAIVTAGPTMNLVLALLVVIALVWAEGLQITPITTIGTVEENTPAAQAGLQPGDRIVSVAGEPSQSWEEMLIRLTDEAAARRTPVPLVYERAGEQHSTALTPVRDKDSRDLWVIGMRYRPDTRVGKVKKGGPADLAGLRQGDVIVEVNGQPVSDFDAIAQVIHNSIGQPVQLIWERGGQRKSASVVPQKAQVPVDYDNVETFGRIFFEQYRENRKVGLAQAVKEGTLRTWAMIDGTVSYLGSRIHQLIKTGRTSADAVSGPIGIARMAGEMAMWGFDRLLWFLAILSVNLFLLNLLPIPVLDGGHAMFIVYEIFSRRRVNQRVQLIATQVGFVLLLLFMVFVIARDVIHLAS